MARSAAQPTSCTARSLAWTAIARATVMWPPWSTAVVVASSLSATAQMTAQPASCTGTTSRCAIITSATTSTPELSSSFAWFCGWSITMLHSAAHASSHSDRLRECVRSAVSSPSIVAITVGRDRASGYTCARTCSRLLLSACALPGGEGGVSSGGHAPRGT